MTALALLLASPAAAGKRYASMLIDRVDGTATLGEPLGLFSNEKTYFDRTSEPGGFKVEDRRDGSLRGVYQFSDDGKIRRRTETLLVLDGDFGAVFAEVSARHQGEKPRASIATGARPRATPRQDGESAKEAAKAVSSFALVRVVRAEPKFLIASADYDAAGVRRAFRVDASTGDWRGEAAKTAEELGMPERIDPLKFAKDPFSGLSEPVFPHEADAALIYGDRGEFVERKVRRGSRVESSRLRFPPTELERALLKAESKLPFGP